MVVGCLFLYSVELRHLITLNINIYKYYALETMIVAAYIIFVLYRPLNAPIVKHTQAR